ncbi:hypothetical protein AS888_17825 [Peribacillus simplex]|uniref:Uncharacterized protein n=1 Tax=Peribacillus simplex TaxID=1478 RepID=A0A120GQK0_9BACI|nr:hypothetical protein AS888_17825 [Peribacillus simplex]
MMAHEVFSLQGPLLLETLHCTHVLAAVNESALGKESDLRGREKRVRSIKTLQEYIGCSIAGNQVRKSSPIQRMI